MIMSNRISEHNKMISAKDISDKYNISYQAVNHYTDLGLLEVLLKRGNVRLYKREIVDRRIRKIMDLRKEGYSLRLIRKILIGI